jgi:cytochrome P450
VAPGDSHLLDPDLLVWGVPHERHRRLREFSPVSLQHLPDGGEYWAVLGHPEVALVSTDSATFSAEKSGMLLDDLRLLPTLLSLDPPHHGEVRRPLLAHFAARAAAALEPTMRAIVRRCFDRARAMGECDFIEDLARPLTLQVICRMLRIPAADRERLGRAADAMAAADDPELAGDAPNRVRDEGALELGGYGYALGQSLASAGGDDLVALLLRSTIGGAPIDLATFSGLFVQILIGGNETTRSLLAGGLLALQQHPDLKAELAADPSLIPDAVEEMLRWVTPVHYFRRTALRDVVLGGTQLREGDRVVMLYSAANRDPRVFDAPETFDVHRRPNPQLAFGFGEHFCVGARIARMEARVFFETLLERFADIELAGPVERVRSNQLNSIKRMPVRLKPRRP